MPKPPTTPTDDAEVLRICVDRDCPSCGWPELVAIGSEKTGPTRVECCRRPPCGYTAAVVDSVIQP